MLNESEGILRLAKQFLASQEALCLIELLVSSGFENCNGESTNQQVFGKL
jgi:hypothetical protein